MKVSRAYQHRDELVRDGDEGTVAAIRGYVSAARWYVSAVPVERPIRVEGGDDPSSIDGVEAAIMEKLTS